MVMKARSKATDPYQEGRAAFLAKGKKAKCPYPCRPSESDERFMWWSGYLDARTDWRLTKVFEDRGIPTMYEDYQRSV